MGRHGWQRVLLFAVILMGCMPRPTLAQATSGQLRQQGEACLRAGNDPCAERAFSAYINLRPADPAGYALRGIVLNRMEQYANSVKDLEHAIDLGEGTWDIFANYADGLRQLGRIDEAIG